MVSKERVSIVKCPSTTEDAEIIKRTIDAIEMLGDYGKGFRNARKIAIKINSGINRIVFTDGKQTELTEPAVVEGAIQAIRKVSDAEIVIGDAPTDGASTALYDSLGHTERLSKYPGVRLIDFSHGEIVDTPMMHPGAMFSSYKMPKELADADAFVSLAKMKAHVSAGCTLSIKNLFGWMPTAIYGVPRVYLHDRLIRLPRVLADLACHYKPCLNVIDGIVATNSSEWHGTPMRPGVIIASTNCAAADSIGARVMGFDPLEDYPNHPFFYRRNLIRLAAELGVGPIELNQIELLGESFEGHCEPFRVQKYEGETNRPAQLLAGSACVDAYLQQQDNLADRYLNRYLALWNGEVLWDTPDMQTMQKVELESGRDWQNAPQFIVKCLPSASEIENVKWYAVDAGLS